jgi:ABC-type branched-subunit amino acid transport system ATPase component
MKDVHCGYVDRPVLNGITLSLSAGETVLLAGPNGCGKSTLLKSIIGALPLSTGTILFEGREFGPYTVERRVNSGIGYLRQTGNIFPSLTVKENLELSGWSIPKVELKHAIGNVLSIFDLLNEKVNSRAGSLSGGQRQALAIAMVLLHKRKLYLLDEPTAGLSPKAAEDIIERIHQFALSASAQAVLMVEHRLELLSWVNRAVILIQGRIKGETSDSSLFLDPEWLAEHYF